MNLYKVLVLALLAAVICAGVAVAAGKDSPSVEKGKTLFNDPKLGTNGKTCNGCHADGKNIVGAGSKPELPDIINGCITQLLMGKALDPKSVEMQSMILYIKSLGAKPKKPAVGC